MTNGSLLDPWRTALVVTASVAAPFLICGLVVGLAVAIFQTATQLQESILTYVPKLVVALVVIALGGHWMLDQLGRFTTAAFTASSAPPESSPRSDAVTLTEPELGAFIVVLTRAGALAATAPVIGDPGVSTRARLIFVLAITAAIGSTRAPVPLDELPATAVLELAVGLVTGMSARFVMSRMAIAGQLMGLSLGLGFASQFDVHAGESAGVLRSLLTAIASLAFLEVGGFEAIVRSVAAGPVHAGDLMSLGPEVLRHATSAFGHGLTLAAPIMLAALVGNIGLAVMNRAAPAINMFSIALGAVLLLGGFVMIASATGIVGHALEMAREAVTQLLGG